jgi:hypothetical protein
MPMTEPIERVRRSSMTLMQDRAYTTQLCADLCRRVASVRSQLLEHNLTDAGSVWDNTEQLIALREHSLSSSSTITLLLVAQNIF